LAAGAAAVFAGLADSSFLGAGFLAACAFVGSTFLDSVFFDSAFLAGSAFALGLVVFSSACFWTSGLAAWAAGEMASGAAPEMAAKETVARPASRAR
jgi:hypothetical protein